MNVLGGADFDAFFHAVHGVTPFPWQSRLARQVLSEGRWPDQLDLPTATGKTAALDIAVFHLAADAHKGVDRRAPIRIAFVVDRRLVVDDAYARAVRIAKALANPNAPEAVKRVGEALLPLAEEPLGDGSKRPLLVRKLRGGVPREDDWARTPSQPTILTSTVDQVGSRLLFRGYGLKHTMAPIHAGLLGADCLILLDEAHLSRPFQQTLAAIESLGRGRGAEPVRPLRWAVMTATPAAKADRPFFLDDADFANQTLSARLTKSKPTRLVAIKSGKGGDAEGEDEGGRATDAALRRTIERERLAAVVEQVDAALTHLKSMAGSIQPVVGVVVNRVLRARSVYEKLVERFKSGEDGEASDVTLVIGPARGVDRERLADRDLAPLRTGCDAQRAALVRPRIVVATQTIEAGVDLDFDALITEVSALDALRQRFGRLNRAGRDILPYAVILAHPRDDLKPKGAGDPIYGFAAAKTWEWLEAWSREGGVDFANEAMKSRLAMLSEEALQGLLTPNNNAPVVMPAYVDLWSCTSPVPAADPDVALFLHGPARDVAKVRLVWRADLTRDNLARAGAVLEEAPPKAAEAVEVSLASARTWMASLNGRRSSQPDFSDVPERESDDVAASTLGLPVYRVGSKSNAGEKPGLVDRPTSLRPGDLLVVPASYGGCDCFGWRPDSPEAVSDVAERAAWPYRERRYAARLSPARLEAATLAQHIGELDEGKRQTVVQSVVNQWNALATRLSDLADKPGDQLEAVLSAGLPPALQVLFEPLRHVRRKPLDVRTPYAADDDEDPYRLGVVIVARFGLKASAMLGGDDAGDAPSTGIVASGTPATEDDEVGSLNSRELDLLTHSQDVECQAGAFARACGLSEAIAGDLALAGWLHDAGKADPRFQALLGTGDPLGIEASAILGKSGRRSARGDWARAGLPDQWRHEALSVRLALANAKLEGAHDPALVLWLVGVHHGWGRPFFPHTDPRDRKGGHPGLPTLDDLSCPLPIGAGPQSLGFSLEGEMFAPRKGANGLLTDDARGLDWAQIFEALKRRYGVWGLAHLEAVVRLADHRASERRDAEEPEE